jgi:hypothetical protein
METKEILTLIGILLVLIVGLINIGITLKNRRNAIREHLFKEQVSFHYKLFHEISKLNREVDNRFNNENSRRENDFELQREIVQNLIYENEFILENETLSLVNKLLDHALRYYLISPLEHDKPKLKEKYKSYYNSYFELLKFTRTTFGIEALSTENKNLHSKNRSENSILSKVVIETLEAATKTIIP